MDVLRAYAPWAYAAHLKDMAVAPYEQGFLLADVPLGRGTLKLTEMVRRLKQAHPEIRFSLEMATRDPLRVPCLNESYWATLRQIPTADLARTLRYVKQHGQSLSQVSHLPRKARIRREEENVEMCLDYARNHLAL